MSVVVVGGGIVGLAIAWRAAQAGRQVTVLDPEPGGGASHAAAGMLAPVTEAVFGEEALLALCLEAHRRWPGFAAELEAAAGGDVGLRPGGSLLVGLDHDDVRAVERLAALQAELGLRVDRLGAGTCRELEPLLSPRIRGGTLAADEASVDGRRACAALQLALGEAGGRIMRERVLRVAVEDGCAVGAQLADGRVVRGSHVVLAAGAWSGGLVEHAPEALPPVRPVKGQVLRLRFDPASPPLTRTLRAVVRGDAVYLVPRADGELVVGATMEERGFDMTSTAGAVHELLRAAIEVLPAVRELELVEAIARLRPATPDNGPVIGTTPVDRLLVATGHHRHGVLLAPLTADAVVAILQGEPPPASVRAFGMEGRRW